MIYELLIPKTFSNEEYKKKIKDFYLKRAEYVKKTEGITKKQFDVLMDVCALSANKEEEYKIDYDYLVNDLSKTGFKIIKETKVWPKKDLFPGGKVGDFIFMLEKENYNF